MLFCLKTTLKFLSKTGQLHLSWQQEQIDFQTLNLCIIFSWGIFNVPRSQISTVTRFRSSFVLTILPFCLFWCTLTLYIFCFIISYPLHFKFSLLFSFLSFPLSLHSSSLIMLVFCFAQGLYHQAHESIAVMFASIPEFTDYYAEFEANEMDLCQLFTNFQ